MKGGSSNNNWLRVQKTRFANARGLSIILLPLCFTSPCFRATISLNSAPFMNHFLSLFAPIPTFIFPCFSLSLCLPQVPFLSKPRSYISACLTLPAPLPPPPSELIEREGMGLLEYKAMPSLRDISYDGWLWPFTGNFISWQLGSSCQGNQYGTEKAGGTARPSHTKSYLPVTLLQPARWAAVLCQPFNLRPHWYGPSITYKITPAGSLSSGQPGRPPFWDTSLP